MGLKGIPINCLVFVHTPDSKPPQWFCISTNSRMPGNCWLCLQKSYVCEIAAIMSQHFARKEFVRSRRGKDFCDLFYWATFIVGRAVGHLISI